MCLTVCVSVGEGGRAWIQLVVLMEEVCAGEVRGGSRWLGTGDRF